MNILELIKSLFSSNKKNAKIIIQDLYKIYGESTPLEVGVYESNNPLINKPINININNKDYTRTTNENGIAKLNINLPVGKYDAHIDFKDDDYHYTNAYVKVVVNPVLITNDLTMTEKDGSKYSVTVQDAQGNKLNGVKVIFTINGINYERTSNDGIASLNINLQAGQYQILTKCNDIIKKNTIYINKKSEPQIENKNHFGYWVFGKDMLNVNLQNLKDSGVTDVFLNYYAVNTHGEEKVLNWINQANNLNIKIHMWMQCFYDGEWHNPKTTDLTSKINEAKKYANMNGVYGVHLDYLRYPGNAYKTSDGADAITNFANTIRNENPNIFLSCAIMPESDLKYYYGQDIDALGKIMNAILPMQYKGNYEAGTSWLASTTQTFSKKANIWSGLQSYKSDDDTTLLSESDLSNDTKTCLNNGAKGVILFRYGLSPNMNFNQFK